MINRSARQVSEVVELTNEIDPSARQVSKVAELTNEIDPSARQVSEVTYQRDRPQCQAG